MAENPIQREIMLAIGRIRHIRIFRNHTGRGVTGKIIKGKKPGEFIVQNGRMTTFGLCPGSPDLVGWETVTVTPEMVGKQIGIMLMIEVKDKDGRLDPDQENFIKVARAAGCKVFVARSAEEAVNGIVTAELGL